MDVQKLATAVQVMAGLPSFWLYLSNAHRVAHSINEPVQAEQTQAWIQAAQA